MTGFESVPVWMWIVGFLLVLGPLVTVHELGHYLVGRWFGVKADVFSVGFGKELAGWTDRRGTRWKLAAIPLGGYVQFKGDMNPASVPDPNLPAEQLEGAFQSKPLGQRALIVFAGPLTNFLVAIAILASFNLAYGKPQMVPVIGTVLEESAAGRAGIQPGDVVVAMNGRPLEDFLVLYDHVRASPGDRLELAVERDGTRRDIEFTLGSHTERDRFGNEFKIGRAGIASAGSIQFTSVGPGEAVTLAVAQTADILRTMVKGIGQIITGRRSVKELGGPIKIAKFSGEQLSLGWANFVWFAALISINLAFINLLPIPALDGGHLAFYAAEAVRRKPLGPRSQEWAFRTGLAFVLALMLFVTVNDIASLPLFGG